MARNRIRGPAAWAAALGTVASLMLVPAAPAQACSCRPPEVAKELQAGRALGVVSRTDDGQSDRATLRVEAAVGGDLPTELSADTGGECAPQILVGGLTALIFDRREAWELYGCAPVDLGLTLQRAQGSAPVPGTGPAVALAAGRYGAGRLVALDERGRPLAWDGQSGSGTRVAACPGGKTVVATGQTGELYSDKSRAELSVHDGTTLKPRRVVGLKTGRDTTVFALRCADEKATRVDLVLKDYGDSAERVLLVSVIGRKVTTKVLGDVRAAAATRDGFLLAPGSPQTSLVRLAADGTRTALVDGTQGDLAPETIAVSPDGASAALSVSYDRGRRAVRTVDAGSGKVLGESGVGADYVTGLAWSAANRLLVRVSDGAAKKAPRLISFDRDMRELGRGSAAAGWKFGAIGPDAVSFDDAPMRVTPVAGPPSILAELRLAATQDVLSLSEAGFATEELTEDLTYGQAIEAKSSGEESSSTPGFLGLLGGAVLIAAAAVFVVRRRRSPVE